VVTLRKYHSQDGLTLLEVMVAVAIVSLAIVSFISLVLSSLDMEERSRKMTEAMLLAEDWMNAVERSGYPELGITEGLIDEKDPQGFSYRQIVTETPIENVRHIRLEIFWNKGKEFVPLETFMVKK
jgi:general secretion pathway protein I